MANVKISDIASGAPAATDIVELQRTGAGASLQNTLTAIFAVSGYTLNSPTLVTPVLGSATFTVLNVTDVGFARNAAGVMEVNSTTPGTFRDLKLRNLIAGGGAGSYIGGPAMTVAQLPSAATAGAGARAFVTDATATTFLSTVAGTGANKVPVVSDGTNWLIG